MVTININIGKKHLFVFCVVIGIVAGMLVAYAYNPTPDFSASGYRPDLMGHSVDEIAWDAAPIMKNIGLGEGSDGRRLWVQGGDADKRTAAFVNDNRLGVAIGAKISDAGGVIQAFKGVVLQELHLNPDGGNVGIGTSNPTDTLDVDGDATIRGPLDVLGAVSAPGIGRAVIYYVGYDDTGETDPDCWLIGASNEWGAAGSDASQFPTQCAESSVERVTAETSTLIRWWVLSGESGYDPAYSHNDQTSGRIAVVIEYFENVPPAY